MRRIILLIYFIFQTIFSSVNAQSNYPLFVTPTLTPPYSLNLSDYCKFGSQKLMVAIHANDLNISNLPIKLKITIETVGVTIETPATIATTPIYINGGETTILFGNDLIDYFNINNLIFRGYSKETYKRTGQLPEGFYKFTVELLHFNTNRIISNQGSATSWIALGKPPILKFPENNAQMGQFRGVPLTFSWLSSNVGSPISANTIQYKFEMWEMHVPGINPNIVAATTPVFHENTSLNTVYNLDPNTLLMTPGMQYAWRVRASDLSGFIPFEQNGQSEIRTFIYKAACDSITNLSSSYRSRNGEFTWDIEDNHTSFNIEMRNPLTNWMSNSESFENKAEFFGLDYGVTYQMRVQAVCDGDPDSKSDFSDWKTLTIPVPNPPDTADCPNCACDDDIPNVELQNFELRNNLQTGDTLVNKTGTSRFIIKTVEDQGGGVYKGLFLFWAEIWNLKFICNYWDLQVNTDNVIVNMDFESVYDPQFLVDVDATINYLDSLAGAITTLITDFTPDDTLSIDEEISTIYVNDGDSVIVVTVDDDGNVTETVISDNVDDLEETLIEGENGEEYVVTSGGQVMGSNEYQNSGGNNSLLNDYNNEQEENNLADDITVNFTASDNQKHGFDQYSEEKNSIQAQYPNFNNGYRPSYKSIASFSTDVVGVSNSGSNIIFKDEMGIPAIKSGEDITLRGSAAGSNVAMYAYQQINDTTEKIAGKINILSFDEQAHKLYIVPVNGANTPDEISLKQALNKVYSQAVTKWEVTRLGDLQDIVFEDGNMTHGGTSAISVYNKDQRTIVNTFEDRVGKLEKNAYYLFFVDNVTFKERSIAGYMPLQRQVGFIYDNPNLDIIAHELGHGAFNLFHTFSPDNFIATEHSTENLMDYKGGTDLWKHQWELVQSPDKMLFAWLQDEEEGESATVSNMEEIYSNFENPDGSLTFLTPSGKPLTIKEKINWIKFVTLDKDDKWEKDKTFLPMGTLSAFELEDGKHFQAAGIVGSPKFNGYINLSTDKYYDESLSKNLDYSKSKVIVGILALEDKKPYFYVQATNYLDKYPNKKTVSEPNMARGDEIGEYAVADYLLDNPSPVRVYAKFAQEFSMEELFFLNHHSSLGTIKGKNAILAFKAAYYLREFPKLLSCMQNMDNSVSGTLNSLYIGYMEQAMYDRPQVDHTYVAKSELFIRQENEKAQEEENEFKAENYFEMLLNTLRHYYNSANNAESFNPSDKIGDIIEYFGEIDDKSFCLLRLLDFKSRKAILNKYSSWTFTTSKETLIQNAVASTPEDQYDDLIEYLSDKNYEKLWAIYGDLGGGNRDKFVAAVCLLNKLVNGDQSKFDKLEEIDPESLLDLEGDDETTEFIYVCQDGGCDIDEEGHYECNETDYDKESYKIEIQFTIDDENWSWADKEYTFLGDPLSYVRVKFLDDYRFSLLGENEKIKAGDDIIVPALWIYHILKEQNQVENMVVLRVVGNIVAVVISIATLEPGPLLVCEIIFAVGDITFAFADEAIANSDNQDLKDAVAVWDGLTMLVGAGAITKGTINGITKIKINKSFFRSNWESIKTTPDLLKKHLDQLTTFLSKAKNGLSQIKNGDFLYHYMLNVYLEGRIIQRSHSIDKSIVQLVNNGNEYVIQAKNGNIANKVAEVVENADGDVVFSSVRWADNSDAALVSAIDDVKYYDEAGNLKTGDLEIVVKSTGQYYLRIANTDILFSVDELMALSRSELPAFVSNNLDNLLKSENRRIIWELTNEVPTGQFKRGDLIEEIFNQWGNKYSSYQNLNDIIPNYRTLDFDGVLADIDEVVSLKSFKPLSDNSLSNFKSKLRSYAKKLNDDIEIAQNHAGKERVLDFVIEESAWTSSQLDDIDDYIVDLYDLFENVNEIRITEF